MMQPVTPAPAVKPKGSALLWTGGILLVGGIVVAILLIVLGVRSLSSTVDGYERVSASEGGTIQIEETGRYTVFLERPGIDEDTATFSGYTLPSVVVQGPSGEPQPLSTGFMQETYSFNGRDGRKLGTFQADQPGAYRLRVTGGGGGGQLAVGDDGPASGLIQLGVGVLVGGAGVVLGIILLIIGGVRRSNSRRTLLPLAPAAGWGPPPGMGGWAPPAAPTHPGWAPPAQPTAPAQPGWAPPPVAVPPPSQPGWTPAPPPLPSAPPAAMPPPLPTDRPAATPPPLPTSPDDPTQAGPIS